MIGIYSDLVKNMGDCLIRASNFVLNNSDLMGCVKLLNGFFTTYST